jgi:hypothetical protein
MVSGSARNWANVWNLENQHMKLNPPKLFLFTRSPDFIFMLRARRLRLAMSMVKGADR